MVGPIQSEKVYCRVNALIYCMVALQWQCRVIEISSSFVLHNHQGKKV